MIVKAVGGGVYASLLKTGKPARGILLKVSSTGTRSTSGRLRLETRLVTIDVEVPGQAPYVVSTGLLIPAQLRNDVLPGATVELRVHPKNKKTMVVVGPGSGLSAALFLPSARGTP